MSVFSGQGSGIADGPKTLGPCKRDYEGEIARLKLDQETTAKLREALDAYLEAQGYYGDGTFTLTSLYGALALSVKQTEKSIARLQGEWEREK